MSYLKIPNLYKSKEILEFKHLYALEKIHGCVDKQATIQMASGIQKSIHEVRKGEEVLSFDINTKTFRTNQTSPQYNGTRYYF